MADQLLSTGPPRQTLPESYVREESQRPRLTEVASDANIPVIDLGADDASQIIRQIGQACQSYGFFQIVNHGMPTGLMVDMKAIAREFFSLPLEEKAKLYSDDPAKKTRLSTSFNIRKETVRNWRDYLRLHCYPLEDFVPEWPSKPPSFRLVRSLLPEDKASASDSKDDVVVRSDSVRIMIDALTSRCPYLDFCIIRHAPDPQTGAEEHGRAPPLQAGLIAAGLGPGSGSGCHIVSTILSKLMR